MKDDDVRGIVEVATNAAAQALAIDTPVASGTRTMRTQIVYFMRFRIDR